MLEAIEELKNLIDCFGDDVDRCAKELDNWLEPQEQVFWFRMYVRSVFALIEGVTYQMKQIAYGAHDIIGVDFSDEEINLLREKSFLKFRLNIRFTFKAVARVYYSDYELPIKSREWQLLLKATEIRNRLMHPKKADDFIITRDEVEMIHVSSEWLFSCLVELQESLIKGWNKKSQELRKQEDELIM